MDIKSTQKKRFSLFFTVLLAGTNGYSLPSTAATLAFSEGVLELDNFSNAPSNVAVINDNEAKAIATTEEDWVNTTLQPDAVFISQPPVIKAQAVQKATTVATGNDYLGRGQIDTKMLGKFSIEAGETLSFDFNGGYYQENSIDTLEAETISMGGFAIVATDSNTNTILDGFYIGSVLDTSLDPSRGKDRFWQNQTSDNFLLAKVTRQQPLNTLGRESFQTIVNGSFKRYFAEDTQVTLKAINYSKVCVQAPKTNRPCVMVNEPSDRLALLLLLAILPFLSGVVQNIIKLACQPFTKHLI